MDKEQLRLLLEAAVKAKLAYWDAFTLLEHAIVPFDGLSDRAGDEVHEQIDLLAAGMPEGDPTNEPNGSWITMEHVDDMIKLSEKTQW